MDVAIVTLNRGRGSGVVARHQVRALLDHGHRASLVHSGEAADTHPVHEVTPSSDLLPVHEYLPGQGELQQPVSTMDAATASGLIGDFEAALSSLDPIPDLIVAHHATITAPATRRAAARMGIPYLLVIHGTGIEPRHHGGYADAVWAEIEASIRLADGLIVTTEYVRDELVRPIVELPVDRFTIIPGGVDLAAYQPGTGDQVRREYGLTETYVISPGAVTELKGPQNVVVASVEYADLAPTIFTGDGDLRSRLAREIGDRGRFLGYIPEGDKRALINAATLLVAAPQKLEHFGMVYVEALAAGTVPVAYRGGGVGSIVTPDVGVLTDRDPKLLGEAVRDLLEQPERRHPMALAGRRRAEQHFDESLLGDRFVDFVEGIAHRALQT